MSRFDDGGIDFSDAFDRLVPSAVARSSAPAAPAAPTAPRFQPNVNAARPAQSASAMNRGGIAHPPPGGFPGRPSAAAPAAVGSMQPGFMSSRPAAYPPAAAASSAAAAAQSTSLPPQPSWMRRAYGTAPASSPLATHNATASSSSSAALYSSAPVRAPSNSSPFFAQPASASASGAGAGVRFTTGSNPSAAGNRVPFRPNLPAQLQQRSNPAGAAPGSFQAQYGYSSAAAAPARGGRPQSAAKPVAFPSGFNPRAAPAGQAQPALAPGTGSAVSKFRTVWEPPVSDKPKGGGRKKAGAALGQPLPPHLEAYAHTPRGKLPAFLTAEDKRLLRAERKRLRAHAEDLTRSSKDAQKQKEVIDLESYSAEYARERKGWNSQRIKVAFQLCSADRVAIETTPRNEMRIINLIQSIPGALFNRELTTSVSKKDSVAGEYGGLKGLWTIPLRSYDAARARLAGLRGDHLDIVILEVDPVHLRALRGESEGVKAETAVATTFESMQGIPPALAKALYPFQKAGVEFCVNHEGRAMIGDEMGLGKTIQAIAVAAYYADEWPLLVVCPSSVRLTWKNELLKWLGFSSLRETDIMEVSSGEELSDAEADADPDVEETEWNPGKPIPTLKSQRHQDQFIEDEDDFDFSGAMMAAKKASKAEAAAAKAKAKAPSPFIAPEDDEGEAEYTPSALSAEKKKKQKQKKEQSASAAARARKKPAARSKRGRIDSEEEEEDAGDGGGDMDDFIVPDSDPDFDDEDEAEYEDSPAAAAAGAASDASSSSSSSDAEEEEAKEDEDYVPDDDLPIHKKKTTGNKRRRIVESSSDEEAAEEPAEEPAEDTAAKEEEGAVPIEEDHSDEEHEKRAAVKLEQPSSPASARSASAAASAATPPKLTPKAEFQARLAARQAASAAASAAAAKFPPKKQARRALPMADDDGPPQQEDDEDELMESLRLIAEMEAKAALAQSAASAASAGTASAKTESALPAWQSKRSAVKAEPGASPKKETVAASAGSVAVVKAEPESKTPAVAGGEDDEMIDLCSTSPPARPKSEPAVKSEPDPAAYVSAASLIDDSFLAVDREVASQVKPAAAPAVPKTAAPMPSVASVQVKSEAHVRASPPAAASASAASASPSAPAAAAASAASSAPSPFVPPTKPAASAAAPQSTFRPLTKNNIHVILSGKSPLMGSASSQTRVVIISYDLVVKYTLAMARQNFKVIIADESHYLKNASAKRSQALLPLLESAKRVLCLSGTPAMSRPYELYPQINAIRPTMFGSAHQFGTRYCAPSRGFRGKIEYKGAQNLLELHMLLKKYVLVRRLKSEVLTDLRPKTRTVIVTSVNDRALAESIRSIANLKQIIAAQIAGGTGAPVPAAASAAASNGGPKKAITQLYADTGLAKLPFILSYLSDLLETGTKFLVFAHHLAVLDGIEGLLRKHHRDAYFRLDGSTKPADRQRGVERFQTDPECKVALLSITAGGTGLTLTSASTVVFAELQWTPALLVQAEDRVHRIGQFNPVNCYYLVAHHTLDEILWPMLSAKLEVLGHTLDGKENALEVAGVQGDSAKTTPMEFKKVAPNAAGGTAAAAAGSSAAAAAAALFGSSSSSSAAPSSSSAAAKRWDSSSRAEVDLTQHDEDDAESEAKHAPSSYGSGFGSGSGSGSRSGSASQNQIAPQPASLSKKVTAAPPATPFSGWIGMSGGSSSSNAAAGGSKTVSPFAASALAAAAAGLTRAPASSSSLRALPPAASVSRLLHRDAALSAHMHSTQHARDVSAEIAAEVEARFEPHTELGPSAQITEVQRAQPPPQDAIIELDGADSDEYHSDEY